MPSKKSARKQREKKNAEVDWQAFTVALGQFKKDGTGSHIEDQLLKEFPLFHGKAPAGHPYPQAFTEGAIDNSYCYVERVEEDLVLLRRELPRPSVGERRGGGIDRPAHHGPQRGHGALARVRDARDRCAHAGARLVDGGEVMVEAIGVTKSFGDVVAVSDVTFQIGSGITAILGPNGAGKSTLLQAIADGTIPGWPATLRTALVSQEVLEPKGLLFILSGD